MIADFLNSIIRKLSNKDSNAEKESSSMVKSIGHPIGSSIGSSTGFGDYHEAGTSFKIYPANGGTIIQTYHFDPIRDKRQSQLYIVPTGESLGKEIELILTKEGLMR